MCGKNGGGKGGKVFGKAKSRSSRVELFIIILIIFNIRVKLTVSRQLANTQLVGGFLGVLGGKKGLDVKII